MDEKRMLAGKLAGVLVLGAGVAIVLLTGKDRALSAVDWAPAA